MLAVGAKPALVSESLHRDSSQVTLKDIYNIRQKLKFKGKCTYNSLHVCSILLPVRLSSETFVCVFSLYMNQMLQKNIYIYTEIIRKQDDF